VQWKWSTAGLSSLWSPDNNWYAFSGYDANHNLELLVAKSDGSHGQTVAGSQGLISGTHALLADYAWSPDSTRLAYLQEGPLLGEPPDQHFDLASLSAQIYTVRPDGSDRRLVLDLQPAPNGIVGVNWSPDGKYLLYSASVGMTGCMHIHLLEVATRVDTELAGVCHALRTALPAWSADSGSLIFTAEVENDPSQGAFVVLLNVPEALRNPAKVAVTRLADSAALSGATLSGATVLDFDPVWQPTGR
jgi:Tol biopolymer transport system component